MTEDSRFAFGENWHRYLAELDDQKIATARAALESLVSIELAGRTFLDVGCGSGIHSLAAWLSGAVVTSFDYDDESVSCTAGLRDRAGAPNWRVEQGSILDQTYLSSLGHYEIVYSWGVLHHTGAMWEAIRNAAGLVAPGGTFVMAIYNYQPGTTERWTWVKRTYNQSGPVVRGLLVAGSFVRMWARPIIRDTVRWRDPLRTWRGYGTRGMDPKIDLIDWVGGYPYEAATPDDVMAFVSALGFSGEVVSTVTGHGCNEFRFTRAMAHG